MVKDKTIRHWRVQREEEFELEYGETHFPSEDYTWKMIESEEGGLEQFEDCRRGFHDYEWMAAICDYVCFFCLDVEPRVQEDEDFDSHDEFLIGAINPTKVSGEEGQGGEGGAEERENGEAQNAGGSEDDAEEDESDAEQQEEDGEEADVDDELGEQGDSSGRDSGTDADEVQ